MHLGRPGGGAGDVHVREPVQARRSARLSLVLMVQEHCPPAAPRRQRLVLVRAGMRMRPSSGCVQQLLRTGFGIGMNPDHTLEEVGQQFSATRERIRQAFAGEGAAEAFWKSGTVYIFPRPGMRRRPTEIYTIPIFSARESAASPPPPDLAAPHQTSSHSRSVRGSAQRQGPYSRSSTSWPLRLS